MSDNLNYGMDFFHRAYTKPDSVEHNSLTGETKKTYEDFSGNRRVSTYNIFGDHKKTEEKKWWE